MYNISEHQGGNLEVIVEFGCVKDVKVLSFIGVTVLIPDSWLCAHL